jgi:hypothetical protein
VLIGAALIGGSFAANATAVPPFDPLWSAGRVDRLPAEVRQAVRARCAADPEAGEYFATFADHSSVIHLDYSALQCGDRPRACTASGCLHQTFAKLHGRYVLTRSRYE